MSRLPIRRPSRPISPILPSPEGAYIPVIRRSAIAMAERMNRLRNAASEEVERVAMFIAARAQLAGLEPLPTRLVGRGRSLRPIC
jgi:hypothetical protein